MATKVVVGGSNVSASQLKDFFRQIDEGSVNGIQLQAFLERRDPFGLDNIVLDWVKVYNALGMTPDWGDSYIPTADPKFFDICVLPGVTPNKVGKALKDLGVKVYLYTEDLTDVSNIDRDPSKGSYTVRFQKTIEADPELQNKSADDLEKEGIKGITLLERLLLELGYFLATGNHLDVDNITLCSGSRYSDGNVPYVHWRADRRKVCVDWDRSAYRYSHLRSRAVVS